MSYLSTLASTIGALVDRGTGIPPESESLFLIYAVLLRAKREKVSNEDVHDAWVAWMEIRRQEHPSMIPFDELPRDKKEQDTPFVDAIRRVASMGAT